MQADYSPDGANLMVRLRAATELDHPYPHRIFLPGRSSAVLALLALEHAEKPKSISILLTRRSEALEAHRGQIAFPGGVIDPEDEQAEGLKTTALRETEEEVGIARDQINVLGKLPELSTMTGYVITPFVGFLHAPHSEISWKLSDGEIAEAFWIPLSRLRAPDAYCREPIVGKFMETDVFNIDHFRIWGATAAILKNLLDRLDYLGLD